MHGMCGRPTACRFQFTWDLDLYVDGTVVEAYATGGAGVITARAYPTLADSVLGQLRALGAAVDITLDYYDMGDTVIGE